MTDKENAAEIIPRKLSFISSTTECRSRAATMVDPLGADIHTPLSALIPSVNNDTDEDLPLFSNRQIYKNLALLSFAFMLMFTAYVGIISLQSSINTKGNVGVNALIVLNAFILFGSLFLTNITMDILELKWTIILGKIAYVFYICANIRPTPILMYCAAGSIGLASAPLWASQAMYISRIVRYHAHYKRKNVADTVSLFFEIFFAFYGTTDIWGEAINTREQTKQTVAYFERMGFLAAPHGHHTVGTINYAIIFNTEYLKLLDCPPDKLSEIRPELVHAPAGSMAIVLKAHDADQRRDTLMKRGLRLRPTFALSRSIDLENGVPRDVKFCIIYLEPDAIRGYHLYYCQRITPELVWRPA